MRYLVCVAVIALILNGCEDLERTNPLDPENPKSERQQVVLVEAFVNAATPYSGLALTALDSLGLWVGPERMVLLEHHLLVSGYSDPDALQESNDRYISFIPADERAVPDVLFNGMSGRVQGASSVATALTRYRQASTALSAATSHFTVEATKTIGTAGIELEVKVARLGPEDFSGFSLIAVVWEDLGLPRRRHLVRKITPLTTINAIAAGETKTMTFTSALGGVTNPANLQVAVLIEPVPNPNREVLQVALAK